MEWDEVKWNGMEWDRIEWDWMRWYRIEWGGIGGDEMGSYRMQWDRMR